MKFNNIKKKRKWKQNKTFLIRKQFKKEKLKSAWFTKRQNIIPFFKGIRCPPTVMILPKQIGEKVTELGERGILMDWQAYDMILTLGIHIMIFQGGNTSWERLRDLSKVRKEPRFKPKFTWLQVCSLSTCEHNGLRKKVSGASLPGFKTPHCHLWATWFWVHF